MTGVESYVHDGILERAVVVWWHRDIDDPTAIAHASPVSDMGRTALCGDRMPNPSMGGSYPRQPLCPGCLAFIAAHEVGRLRLASPEARTT